MLDRHDPSNAALEAACQALGRLAQSHVGTRLFTLMTFDEDTGHGHRFHSSMPEIYPVSGRKPIPRGIWFETVIERREVFVANSIEDIADVFPDHELIRSIGCESVLNIPVWNEDTILGTVNCLDRAGAYGPDRVAAAADLRLPAIPCFLMERACRTIGDDI